jgi:hypothetical protein
VHLPHHAALKGDFRMKRQMGFAAMLVAAIALSALVVPAAADWPTYRHNPSRNATATAQLGIQVLIVCMVVNCKRMAKLQAMASDMDVQEIGFGGGDSQIWLAEIRHDQPQQ